MVLSIVSSDGHDGRDVIVLASVMVCTGDTKRQNLSQRQEACFERGLTNHTATWSHDVLTNT